MQPLILQRPDSASRMEETLLDPKLFLAHLMTYGTLDDIATGMRYYTDADFDLVLKDPPAGIFDRRSWNYWNLRYHHEPVPPLPQRMLPGTRRTRCSRS